MEPTIAGLFAGLIVGLAWAIAGFDGFLITAFLGLAGYVAGRVLAGQLDLTPYLSGRGGGTGRRYP